MNRLSKRLCETADHDGLGCLGYQHGNDDEPIEQCKCCKEYISNNGDSNIPNYLARCADCNRRTIDYQGYSYCPKMKIPLLDIWNYYCNNFSKGNDGINPYKEGSN